MYKPFPPKARLTGKTQYLEKNPRKASPLLTPLLVESRKESSPRIKMEEKYVYNVRKSPAGRSSSIGATRKQAPHTAIDEEYRPTRPLHLPLKEILPQQPQLELRCISREGFKEDKEKGVVRLRLLRARSNDSMSRAQALKAKQNQNQMKLQALKDQNLYLQQLHTQSLKKIAELQQLRIKEEGAFEGEKKVYERQIELLRGKVERNKVDIGHLYSYDNFDPATLLVRPIIEVQENSSILRSLQNTRSALRKPSIQSQYGLIERQNRKIPTETTALSSEHCRQMGQLI